MIGVATDFCSVPRIDDSRDTREVIHRHLAGAGYTVYTRTVVDVAVAFLETNPIDRVIANVRMPRANGLAMITYVREKLKRIEARKPRRKPAHYTFPPALVDESWHHVAPR